MFEMFNHMNFQPRMKQQLELIQKVLFCSILILMVFYIEE
nr:hypothetical protein [Klebsiella michiganensis]